VSPPLVWLAWTALGVAVGGYGTLIGAGGGFVLVPILLIVYPHQSAAQLTAVSLAVVFANATSGSVGYYRLRRVDYRSGVVLALATLPGAVLGALVVGAIPRAAFDVVMGLALILVAGFLFFRPAGNLALLTDHWSTVVRELVDSDGKRYRYRFNLALATALSVIVGFLSSLLGIGGGIIHVPMLSTFFSFPPHIATATSHFVLMVMAAGATITHILHRDFGSFVPITLALSVGVILGAQVGARASSRVGGGMIIRLLALALAIVGVRLLLIRL
jgi:uncharacterized membrane protein YfcA